MSLENKYETFVLHPPPPTPPPKNNKRTTAVVTTDLLQLILSYLVGGVLFCLQMTAMKRRR